LLVNKPYFFELKPEGKEFSIDDIRNLIRQTNTYHKDQRVFFLENFHLSSLEAQNAFLKLLEEPPNKTLFVLSSISENKLIPTVISRTKIIKLDVPNKNILSSVDKEILTNLISGKTLKLHPVTELDLDKIILFFSSRISSDKKALIILKEAIKIKNLQENNNINKQLSLDHILILIFKTYKIN
jgi:DNA polymerase III delta prime subunit